MLVFAVFLIRPTWVNSAQDNEVNIISSFLLLPANTLPLVSVGWTLIHELYFYFVFFLLLLLIPERCLSWALCLWGTVVVISNLCYETSNPILRLISHPLTLEFIAGCFLAKIFYQAIKVRSGLLLSLGLTVMVAMTLGYSFFANDADIPQGWWRVALYGPPACLLAHYLACAEKKARYLHPFFIKLGDASYSIYLSHVLVLSAAGKV